MARPRLEPTVTIGGALAGYKPTTTFQPTVTIGGAPAGYTETITPNYITGEGVPGSPVYKAPTTPNYITGEGVPGVTTKPIVTDEDKPNGGNNNQRQDNSDRQSAYDLLLTQFKQYGLEALVTPLKGLITDPSISESEFTLRLRESDAYKTRFAANAARIGKGLRALNEADYIALEDQYQNVMRNYGLPASYYAKGDLGRQEALEKFIAGDVSAAELEDRIITAQDRVLKANPEVLATLKNYYGDAISNGDILAYALNPEQGLKDIQRKVTAAEIGGAALAAGLNQVTDTTTAAQKEAMRLRSEELAGAGVTKQQAQQQYGTVAELAERGGVLADIYKQQPYGQAQAEAEVFSLSGQTEAAKQRKKIRSLETAAFSGSSGAAKGALERERVNGAGAI